MVELLALAEVLLWGKRVGAVSEEANGVVTFEYDPLFARFGLEISPVNLPLSTRGPVVFPELRRSEAFEGLPGVLADALPDRFGNAVISRYFSAQGRPEAAMSPVQKLLYIGHRALGALEFEPAERGSSKAREKEALQVAELVEQARILVEGRVDIAVPEMMRVGSSAGGARPKAVVLWDRTSDTLRSGLVEPKGSDEPWIIKFDGVGMLDAPDSEPRPYNRIEYVYSRMAREAGLDVPETRLLKERRLAHLMVRRFDRAGVQRLHQHSLGGMHHVDFNEPGRFSYEQFLRTILFLNLGYPALEEAFRRIVFNVLAVNQDDHVKNLSFLMDETGAWSLAPAYDLTYAKGRGYTRVHQMTLAGKSEGITIVDLLAVGENFGIERGGKPTVDRAVDALRRWSDYAREAGIPNDRIQFIANEFKMRANDAKHNGRL